MLISGFNSRSREGSDIVENTELLLWFVSIHAPVKGATDYGNIVGGPDVVSIHAPVKGATKELTSLRDGLYKFQFTLP